MNRIGLCLALSLLSLPASADVGPHKVDKAHSKIGFKTYTKLFNAEGHFKKWSAKARFDAADLSKSSISITVDTASVDTASKGRDDHLRKEDFFYCEKFPKATFTSTGFKKFSKDSFEVEGDLTIRGVTKRVKVPFQWTEVERHKPKRLGGAKYLSRRARGQIRLVRQDYGINYKAGLLLPSIDKNVDLIFDVNFVEVEAKK